jgi:hypothetical protein
VVEPERPQLDGGEEALPFHRLPAGPGHEDVVQADADEREVVAGVAELPGLGAGELPTLEGQAEASTAVVRYRCERAVGLPRARRVSGTTGPLRPARNRGWRAPGKGRSRS